MLFGKHVNMYYIKYGLVILLGIAALLAVDFFQLQIPEIIGDIIDGLKLKTLTKGTLQDYMIDFVVIALVMFSGRFLWRICLFGTGIRVECDLRNKVFKNMQRLSQRFFSNNKTGSLMAIYTNDLSAIRATFGSGTIMFVDAVCLGTLALIKMFSLNIFLSVCSLVSLVIVSIFASLFGKKITTATENNYKAFGRLSDYVQEDLSGIAVIKAFVKEKLQIKRFSRYNQENMDSTLVMTKISLKMQIIITAILSIINILIIGYGGYLIYMKSIGDTNITFTLGDLTKFSAYFGSLIWPIEAVGRLIDLRSQGNASLNRIKKILEANVDINDLLAQENISELKGDIEYRNLSFAYPDSTESSLENVSFKIKAGEFVGIIGETGSGKTTLVDLLLRIYNIEEGMLYIDGVDIMHLKVQTIRQNIAYVPQDNFLFSDKIINNIAFSDTRKPSVNNVNESAELADVSKDIEEFKEKYETILGERGVTVSGGQKQRISIARALYKNANILILDDSLSAVDTETEKTIINNLRKNRAGKTTIIIAHRITTLQNLDKIVVVEDGKVSGVGTHDELILSNETYAREVKLQELEKEEGDNND